MKYSTRIIIVIFTYFVLSCNSKSKNEYSTNFNQKIWLENGELGNGTENSPRARMIDDLIKNYLKEGMTKSEIIALLGNPYKDGIEQRLPKGIEIPDSLDIVSTVGKSIEVRQKALVDWNNWYSEHSQPDTLLLYTAGWSYIDPNSLVIKLNDKDVAYEFWLEQH